MPRTARPGFVAALAALALSLPETLEAQATAWTWENATELSFVSTGGNASSSTLGLKAALTGSGAPNGLKLELGGVRAESERTIRTATGDQTTFTNNETTVSELTAESYFSRARYDRALGAGFLFTGGGWERNTFAGVQNRFSLVGGFGRTWVDGESGRFKTDLGGTYTVQKDVEPVPGADDAFGGLRVTLEATRQVSPSAELASTLIADENLEERGDFRADWVNSLAVSISEGLALKTAVQILYDSEPAFIRVPLVDGTGTPTGLNVRTRGNKVDSVLTLALVIKL
jgi:putative salt-induced outer membrane protein YdiY